MYTYFETMADIGIIAVGTNLEESFQNSAKGLFNLMVDVHKIQKFEKRYFELESDDLEGLLYDFLTELLILHDSEALVFSEFDIEIIKKNEGYFLKCSSNGDFFTIDKYEPKEEVKAITYHRMNISNENEVWKVEFIVDL
ncbi:archease [Methanococcus vannielii]|nr:archease [Methanococcus vannielii]